MELPGRVVLSRVRGWRKPGNTVVVARPSIFGNVFRVVPLVRGESWRVIAVYGIRGHSFWGSNGKLGGRFETIVEARAMAVRLYREWLDGSQEGTDLMVPADLKARIRSKLRGKHLACWCPLDGPCHADVLLEVANADGG